MGARSLASTRQFEADVKICTSIFEWTLPALHDRSPSEILGPLETTYDLPILVSDLSIGELILALGGAAEQWSSFGQNF